MTHTYGTSGWVSTVDGRRLHYMVGGSGPVTVVFESGLGLSRSVWGLVAPAVAAQTRAVVYDRAGTGRSDPDPAPRTVHRLADDLLALLAGLGDGPFVLCGHSWGGPIVRVAAAQSAAVRALVLVDPSDEHCDLYFGAAARLQFGTARLLGPLLTRSGISRRLGSRPGLVQPADVAAEHRAEDFSPRAERAGRAELRHFVPGLRELRQTPPDLGSRPVTLICGTAAPATRTDRVIRPALTAAHRTTVAGLPHARLVEAPASGHLVMFTDPDIITAEVLRLAPTSPPPSPHLALSPEP